MRGRILLLAVAWPLGTWASEPGQPLDCSDWVINEPGLTCSTWASRGSLSDSSPFVARGSNLAIDNSGAMYSLRHTWLPPAPYNGERLELLRLTRGGVEEVLATIRSRPRPNGGEDRIRPITSNWDASGYDRDYRMPLHSVLSFDAVNGRLLVPAFVDCSDCGGPPSYYDGWTILAFDGLAPLYEIQQSYIPPSSIGFHVPTSPEGMRAADHFDTYWGDLTPAVDFTQAHPLQCGFPADPPQVGEYLTVPDPLPNPDAGHGRWYLTAATYQGETRYGRKGSHGHLSGRDPALLPACAQP